MSRRPRINRAALALRARLEAALAIAPADDVTLDAADVRTLLDKLPKPVIYPGAREVRRYVVEHPGADAATIRAAFDGPTACMLNMLRRRGFLRVDEGRWYSTGKVSAREDGPRHSEAERAAMRAAKERYRERKAAGLTKPRRTFATPEERAAARAETLRVAQRRSTERRRERRAAARLAHPVPPPKPAPAPKPAKPARKPDPALRRQSTPKLVDQLAPARAEPVIDTETWLRENAAKPGAFERLPSFLDTRRKESA